MEKSGLVPGPTEWDIRIMAIVPEVEIEQWFDGLTPASAPDQTWVSNIPNALGDLRDFKWYEDSRRIVGVNREIRMVLYRSSAN